VGVSLVCVSGKPHGFWGAHHAEVGTPMHPRLAEVVARESRAQRKGWVGRIQRAERRYGQGVLVGVGVAARCGRCGARLVASGSFRGRHPRVSGLLHLVRL
jgi:hypothetical protein